MSSWWIPGEKITVTFSLFSDDWEQLSSYPSGFTDQNSRNEWNAFVLAGATQDAGINLHTYLPAISYLDDALLGIDLTLSSDFHSSDIRIFHSAYTRTQSDPLPTNGGPYESMAFASVGPNAFNQANLMLGSRTSFSDGTDAQARLIVVHEFVHTLGIKHPNNDTGDGNIFMDDSIMSKTLSNGVVHNRYSMFEVQEFAQTAMARDLRDLQAIYGAEYSTRSDNTVYSWSTTTGELLVNGSSIGIGGHGYILQTVWDGGGIDWYDFQNFDTLSIDDASERFAIEIDLEAGGNSQINVGDLTAKMYDTDGTLVMARWALQNPHLHQGNEASLIENVRGTSMDDFISGNQLNNDLRGRGGDDVLRGMEGDDVLWGGAGDDLINGGSDTIGDTAVWSGRWFDYDISFEQQLYGYLVQDTISSRDGVDTVQDIEFFQFANGTVSANSLLNDNVDGAFFKNGWGVIDEYVTISAGTIIASVRADDSNALDRWHWSLSDISSQWYTIDSFGDIRTKQDMTFDWQWHQMMTMHEDISAYWNNGQLDTNAIYVDDWMMAYEGYAIQLEVLDEAGLRSGAAVTQQTLYFNIKNVNQAPDGIYFDNLGNPNAGNSGTQLLGSLHAYDLDYNDQHTWEVLTDFGGHFTIATDGSFYSHGLLTASSYDVQIKVTDSAGASFIDFVTVTRGDENNNLHTDFEVDLQYRWHRAHVDQAYLARLFDVHDADDDDRYTFVVVGQHADKFEALTYRFQEASLFVRQGVDLPSGTYDIEIDVIDQDGQHMGTPKVVSVTLEDPQPITDIVWEYGGQVYENSAAGTVIGKIRTVDANIYNYASFWESPYNSSFDVSYDGIVTVGWNVVLNHEAAATQSFTIRAQDNDYTSFTKTLSISVLDVNEAPRTITADLKRVDFDSAAGSTVAILSVSDPDRNDSHTYALTEPSPYFEISGNKVVVKAGATLPITPVLLSIIATDSGGLSTAIAKDIVVEVVPNEAPTGITWMTGGTVTENAPANTLVGRIQVADADVAEVHTFSLATGSDLFTINAAGEIRVKSGALIDYEATTQHDLSIEVMDRGGHVVQFNLAVGVLDAVDVINGTSLGDTLHGAEGVGCHLWSRW